MRATVQITYTSLNEGELAKLLWLGLAETHRALPTTEPPDKLIQDDAELPGEDVRGEVQIGLAEYGMAGARSPIPWSDEEERWCRKQVRTAYGDGRGMIPVGG